MAGFDDEKIYKDETAKPVFSALMNMDKSTVEVLVDARNISQSCAPTGSRATQKR